MRLKILKYVWLIFFLLYCSGCAFINLPSVFNSISQLKEHTLEGEGKNKILMMDISGTISAKNQRNALGIVKEINPVARTREVLEKARQDKKIKAILLKINSPGGTVTASDIIYHELKTFKKETGIPIVVTMMDLATSGGYYIALAGDKIMAHPTTTTGNIGVLMMKFTVRGLMDKLGVEEVTIKSADKKDILSIFAELTPENQAILQDIIDTLYLRFIDTIAESRPDISRKEIKKIADGRIYSAQQALKLKLIDGIGYIEDSIALAKKEAGLTQAKIITYQRHSQYKNNIYAQSSSGSSTSSFPILENLSPQFWYLWHP